MNAITSLSSLFFMIVWLLSLVHGLLAVCLNFILLPVTILLIAVLKLLFPKSVTESVESIGNRFVSALCHVILITVYVCIVALVYPLPFIPQDIQMQLTEIGAPLKSQVLDMVHSVLPKKPE